MQTIFETLPPWCAQPSVSKKKRDAQRLGRDRQVVIYMRKGRILKVHLKSNIRRLYKYRYAPQPLYEPFSFYAAVRMGLPEQLNTILEKDPYFVTQVGVALESLLSASTATRNDCDLLLRLNHRITARVLQLTSPRLISS